MSATKETNFSPMDNAYIEQHDVSRKYLQGKLTPEEAQAFEIYLLDNPSAVSQVELDLLLSKELRSLATPRGKKVFRFPSLFKASLRLVAIPLSAFGIGLLTMHLLGASDNMAISVAKPHMLDLSVPRSAGSEITATYQLNANEDMLLLLLSPEAITTEPFIVSLTDSSGDTLFSDVNVRSTADGNIYLSVPTKHLNAGTITVEYSLNAPQAPIERVIINVIH